MDALFLDLEIFPGCPIPVISVNTDHVIELETSVV
jgi:hypothetical protein